MTKGVWRSDAYSTSVFKEDKMVTTHKGLRDLVLSIQTEAQNMAGAAARIHCVAQEVTDRGGLLQIQQQVSFLVGCLMRMQKDWGAVEYRQCQGAWVKGRKP